MESVKYIKEDDLKRIREVLKYKNKPVILELINFGVNVALRISDLQKLKFEDITKDNKIILREQKTGKTREIQLNNTCVKAVANLKKVYKELGYPTDSGYIFKSLYRKYVKEKEDHYISKSGVNDYLAYLKDLLNIDYPIASHSLRKTWGYTVYKKTHNIALVMKALNHTSEAVTLRYIGIEQEQLDDTYLSFEI